jgi:WD40 repeat protein
MPIRKLLQSYVLIKWFKLWNKQNGDLVRTLNGHGGSVWSVAFASNNILACGSDSYDKKIRIWDTNTGNMLRTLSGHGNLIWQVAFDSNDLLASSSWDRTIKL